MLFDSLADLPLALVVTLAVDAVLEDRNLTRWAGVDGRDDDPGTAGLVAKSAPAADSALDLATRGVLGGTLSALSVSTELLLKLLNALFGWLSCEDSAQRALPLTLMGLESMTGLERGVSELVMAAMFAPFAIARSVLSKSAMRFISCEIIASFSSTRLDMEDSSSLSLLFSVSAVDSIADEPNSKGLGSRGMLLGVFELQVFPSKLTASSIVFPTSIGCCR